MDHTTRRFAQLILFTASIGASGLAAAALKDTPPEGVSLSGTEWRIDTHRSDDPSVAIERAEQAAQDRANRQASRSSRGVFDGDDDTWGGGGGFPDRTGRNGGYTTRGRNSSTTIDPTGGMGSIAIGSGGGRRGNEFLDQLAKSPQELAIVVKDKHVTVLEDLLETDCNAGEKTPLADSYGDGERTCGWSGRALVIETKRGNHFRRKDQYELSKDGKTLSYVTNASGRDMPDVRISRTYTLAPSK